jgi:DNA-directed RNA polymerase subunit K/omega
LNTRYLEKAKEHIPNVPLLINVISKRVRQLNGGHRPLVKPDDLRMTSLDLALKEVAEGTLTAEMGFRPVTNTTGDNLITL